MSIWVWGFGLRVSGLPERLLELQSLRCLGFRDLWFMQASCQRLPVLSGYTTGMPPYYVTGGLKSYPKGPKDAIIRYSVLG